MEVPGNPNVLTDRAAMGLPDTVVTRLQVDTLARHADLLRKEADALVATVQDPEVPFERRYAAGSVLGIVGDPRIRPEDPEMVQVPGSPRIRLGLAREEVARVTARWRHAAVEEAWITKECPVHERPIRGFAIMRYPVTNLEYLGFLHHTGSPWLPSSWRLGSYLHQLSNHPVWTVPPEAADAYAHWLSERTGRRFRLPSEAEWEYAASGGDGREFPWGAEFDPTVANTVEAGPLTTTPVGIYPAGRSSFGVEDLAGNVEEYTADGYRPYPGGDQVSDDLARAEGSYRIARGGSFTRFGDLARCQRRHGWYKREIYAVGFRLAESV